MQGQLSIRGLSAGALLEKAYSTESMGIGVQREIVGRLIKNPYTIRGTKYLEDAHGAGIGSGMVDYVVSDGERVFPAGNLLVLKSDIGFLGRRWKVLTTGLWHSMAYGRAPERGKEPPWGVLDVMLLFKNLAKKGYVTGIPSIDMFRKISKDGRIDRETTLELKRRGIRFNYAAISHEYWRITLGEAKPDHVRFHAAKLDLMAKIAEGAMDVMNTDLGENDYTASNPGTRKKWKELFEEDAPPMRTLIASAREVASSARNL